MALVKVKRSGEVARLLTATRRETTPFRVRCVRCGKILGELGDGGAATLHCRACDAYTLGAVEDSRLALVDMGAVVRKSE